VAKKTFRTGIKVSTLGYGAVFCFGYTEQFLLDVICPKSEKLGASNFTSRYFAQMYDIFQLSIPAISQQPLPIIYNKAHCEQ
jgi:hypothetical protein